MVPALMCRHSAPKSLAIVCCKPKSLGTRSAATFTKLTGSFIAARASNSRPCAIQILWKSSRNWAPNRWRVPLGRPRGLPDCPLLNCVGTSQPYLACWEPLISGCSVNSSPPIDRGPRNRRQAASCCFGAAPGPRSSSFCHVYAYSLHRVVTRDAVDLAINECLQRFLQSSPVWIPADVEPLCGVHV